VSLVLVSAIERSTIFPVTPEQFFRLCSILGLLLVLFGVFVLQLFFFISLVFVDKYTNIQF